MTTDSTEKVLERVKKLLRLADPKRGATEAEQQAAAEAAQRLLLQHNLRMEAVGNVDIDGPIKEEIEAGSVPLADSPKSQIKWKTHLLWKIAKPLMCRAVWNPHLQKMHLVGTQVNIQIVNYLFGYLALTIERMSDEHVKGQKAMAEALLYMWDTAKARAARYAFCIGAIETLARRLDEQYRKARATSASTTSLALRSDQALEAFYNKLFPKTRKQRLAPLSDYASRLAGQD